ncbi:hypothetical protein MKX03_019324 [Papaver bracteatum]|nr:hypothetical protein MKX03_019324 [Papaver bracteatum]
MVQFSKEPNSLYNVNYFKHSGNAKTVSVKMENIEGVVRATTNPNKQKNPSSLVGKTVMKKKISRTDKVVSKLPHLLEDNDMACNSKIFYMFHYSSIGHYIFVVRISLVSDFLKVGFTGRRD